MSQAESCPGRDLNPYGGCPPGGLRFGKPALLYLIVPVSVGLSTMSVGALLFRTSAGRAVPGNPVQGLCRKPAIRTKAITLIKGLRIDSDGLTP